MGCGGLSHGRVLRGEAGMATWGEFSFVMVRNGKAVKAGRGRARRGLAGRGEARHDKAVKAWHGQAWRVGARQSS